MKLMENSKRIGVLLVCLFVLSQTLLANTCTIYTLSENKIIPSFSLVHQAYTSSFVKQNNATITAASPTQSGTDDDQEFRNSYSKYKKKHKRIQHFSHKIKTPVKILTPFTPVQVKETYSQPYFLLHLHHFLFRLTPF